MQRNTQSVKCVRPHSCKALGATKIIMWVVLVFDFRMATKCELVARLFVSAREAVKCRPLLRPTDSDHRLKDVLRVNLNACGKLSHESHTRCEVGEKRSTNSSRAESNSPR